MPQVEVVSSPRPSLLDLERSCPHMRLPSPISISPPPPTFCHRASSLSISTIASDALPELPEHPSPLFARSDPSESVLSFSPPHSITELNGIYPQSGGSTALNIRYSPTLSVRIPSELPHSVITSDTSSMTRTEDTSRSFATFFGRKKRKEIAKLHDRLPLPDSIAFVFSSSGHNLVLWRKDGDSLIHIKIASWESKSLQLKHTLPYEETNHGINVKLVAEGDGWISAVIYHKKVRSSPKCLAVLC
jgi:hypothetical protein